MQCCCLLCDPVKIKLTDYKFTEGSLLKGITALEMTETNKILLEMETQT